VNEYFLGNSKVANDLLYRSSHLCKTRLLLQRGIHSDFYLYIIHILTTSPFYPLLNLIAKQYAQSLKCSIKLVYSITFSIFSSFNNLWYLHFNYCRRITL